MNKENSFRIRWRFLIVTAVYSILLLFFYYRYVPLTASFQAALMPILMAVFLLAVINCQWGILFFIFAFPLINNLPYFFNIYENVPHAPTALVLFLFFFLGWLVNSIFSKSKLSFGHPIYKPITLLSILILISGLITFLRYANFFPFLADSVYELKTNVDGVSAGGAIMSAVFFALNYLTGWTLFFIVMTRVEEREFIKKIGVVLLISTAFSLGFGFYQHYGSLRFGNNPLSFTQGFINGTFKDAMSFGGYLAVMIPILLSMVLFFKGVLRIFSVLVFLSAVFLLPNTGSRSGLVSLAISLLFFLGFHLFILKRQKSFPLKKIVISGAAVLLVCAVIISVLLFSQGSIVYKRMNELWVSHKEGGLDGALAERSSSLWRAAVQMIKDYPLSGVGIGAFIIELPNYARTYGIPLRTTDSAENYFIQVFVELGIIGLFFAVWIFGLIFKRMRKGFDPDLSADGWKHIQIGVSCGIISMFMIFLVHTFIGSYELKYTFWLLVAMLFVLNRSDAEAETKIVFSKKFKFLGVILILIFTALQLWNSTHSLSLKHQNEVFKWDHNFGFYDIERTSAGKQFQWTKKNRGLTITVTKPVIEIPMMASHPDIRENPVKVQVYLIKDFFREKRLLDEITLRESSWKTYEYHLPDEVDTEVLFLFKVSRTWNPRKMSGASDTRDLGVALGEIGFKTK
ncbi:MAG: O-antigen ligase family protein [Candidatus Aminicenantales bacterium]